MNKSTCLMLLVCGCAIAGCERDDNEPSVMDETTPAEKAPLAKPIPAEGMVATNLALDQRLYNRLTNTIQGDFHIDLKEDGVVVLKGTVASQQDKEKAHAAIQHMTGVKEVRNELRVNGTNE